MHKYTDLKNNTYKVKESCIFEGEERELREKEAVWELYRIFTRKSGLSKGMISCGDSSVCKKIGRA